VKKNVHNILAGEHTRKIVTVTPTDGIMKFAKKKATCVVCKTPLSIEGAVCEHCKSREAEFYQKHLYTVNDLEHQFSRLWTQCQRCSCTLHSDILCTSRDCPIFYRRTKVQKDLKDAYTSLERFENDW